MWNTLIPAIMPFVGVIIGAAITTGANYVLAVRKEKAEEALVARKEAAEAAKDNVVRANELRIAARLVRNELYAAFVSGLAIIDRKEWVHGEVARNYPLDSWHESKGVLARELSFDDYQAVELATRVIDHFRATSAEREELATLRDKLARSKNEPYYADSSLSKYVQVDEFDSIKKMIEDVKAGLDALLPYTATACHAGNVLKTDKVS